MKDLKNLGKTLNKVEQKEIKGGGGLCPSFLSFCTSDALALSQQEGGPCILVGTSGQIGTLQNGKCCS